MSVSNDSDNSISRRARATRFENAQAYSTATTIKEFALAPGIYEVAAENAEIYVLDGQQSNYVASQWGRIEAGDYKVWESRKAGDLFCAYCSTGATIRITRRSNG